MEVELCGYKVLIDDEDYENIIAHKWYVNHYSRDARSKIYFQTNARDSNGIIRIIQLHRLIMSLKTGDGKIVDHASGDTLDNRKQNLRVCTISENVRNQKKCSRNKTGFKGVSLERSTNKYRACIGVNGKCLKLGRFSTPELAHAAYCEASKKYHGEFGRTE